jgi:hypothetical protein
MLCRMVVNVLPTLHVCDIVCHVLMVVFACKWPLGCLSILLPDEGISLTRLNIYIYIYICVCVCVRVALVTPHVAFPSTGTHLLQG